MARPDPYKFPRSNPSSPNRFSRVSPGLQETQGGIGPLTPVDFVYDDLDDDFGRKVCEAYLVSQGRQDERKDRYGVKVARDWKKGSTPPEARGSMAN
ncbi:hypothetical protein XANCAGTX0491_010000 [Xanthoria calcicola]